MGGLAELFSGALSMGSAAYLSTTADELEEGIDVGGGSARRRAWEAAGTMGLSYLIGLFPPPPPLKYTTNPSLLSRGHNSNDPLLRLRFPEPQHHTRTLHINRHHDLHAPHARLRDGLCGLREG